MKWSRGWIALGLMVLGASALGLPRFMTTFHSTYGIKATSKIAKAGCAACHTKAPALNPYGLQLQKAMKAAKTKALAASVLKKVEGLSAAGDGVRNIDKIHKDQLPSMKAAGGKSGGAKSKAKPGKAPGKRK